MSWSAALNHERIRKKQMDMRKKKGRAAEGKKMEKEMVGENEEVCLLPSIWFFPGALIFAQVNYGTVSK